MGEVPGDGIYIGLDNARYQAAPALGSTALKEIAIDPVEYQWGRLHAEEKDSAALLWGEALHARVLEGRQALRERFISSPTKEDFPGCLITADDLKDHCETLGLKKTGSKSELVARVRERDQTIIIWDEVIELFDRQRGPRRVLSAKVLGQIEQAAQWMQADAQLAAAMEDGTIRAGISELSIFYTNPGNGVKLKARLDKVLAGAFIDLKSFSRQRDESLEQSVIRAIIRFRYDLQAAAYLRAWRYARMLHEAGLVCGGTPEQRAFLDQVFALGDANMKWLWIFVKNNKAPQPLVRELSLDSFFFKAAKDKVEEAIDCYACMVETFGADKDWLPQRSTEIIQDHHIPSWFV